MTARRPVSGFTLVELMITVVILGILAAIAYPSYNRFIYETRRSDAQIALTRIAADMEKFYAECNGSYPTSLTAARTCAALGLGATSATSPEGYYALTLSVVGATYTITATKQGKQAADNDCATLTLNNAGIKGATGANTSRCWRK